jgi:hypothetical protein
MGTRPGRDAFTARERRLIDQLSTPARVQRWLSGMRYNREEGGGTLRTFRGVVRDGRAHCLEAALAAACILEQHGHPPLLLSLESQDKLDHVLFVFRGRDGRFGAVARSRDLGLHGRRPVFRSLRDLAWSYFDTYVDYSGRITGYGLGDLYELGGYDWRFSERNVWKVERYLQEIPHRALNSSDARYERLLARYTEFRRRHPAGHLEDYETRGVWMI